MCGIAGIIHFDNRPVDFRILQRMTDTQKHRGPDDQGLVGFSFLTEEVIPIDNKSIEANNSIFHGGIGFNRLSVIDLSLNGHQPMISDNEKVIIAYNGETYNAFSFKNELEKKGIQFKSKTDTEILLNLYLTFGIERLLELVNGMFAFCIVDLEKKVVFLARDHVGIKPLYWWRSGDTILFASEIKSFLYYPDFRAEINATHLDEYLYYKYCAYDRTLFKGVRQIPPGYYLKINPDGVTQQKYWEPRFDEKNDLGKKAVAEKLEEILKESIQSQLISDVEIGCQLSGGIDSSLITTLASLYLKANINSFSILPVNRQFSEEQYIDQVIEVANPKAFKFNFSPGDFFENLFPATWHLDCPLPIAQAVGIKWLARNSSEFVTVLLSGEGSDELMGGYYQFYHLAFKIKNKSSISLLSKIPYKGEKIKKQYMPECNVEDFFIRSRASVPLPDFIDFRPDARLDMVFEQRKQLMPEYPDLLKRARLYDMRTWMANLLNIQDKMCMAHSIENRVPFLDRNFIDLVFSLPSDFFIRSSKNPLDYNSPTRNTKVSLKTIASKYYSSDFVFRKKMGFNQPLKDYFNYPEFVEMANDQILPGIKDRGLFDYKKLMKEWESRNSSNNVTQIPLLWNCLSFEVWAQIFIDKSYS